MRKTLMVRLVAIPAVVAALASCTSDPGGPITTPGTIAIASGNPQQGLMGGPLPSPLGVRVTDAIGQPVAGARITFEVASGGGHVSPTEATTDPSGLAATTWTLGAGPGAAHQSVRARLEGSDEQSVLFRADASPRITRFRGDSQTGEAAQLLAGDPTVIVEDASHNPIPGMPVTWRVTNGGGSVSAVTAATDESGQASARWALGASAGAGVHTLEARAGAAAVTIFTATGILTAGSLEILAGDGQFGITGRPLTDAPRVVVRTPAPSSQVIAGVAVEWSVVEGGGSITAEGLVTNSGGVSWVDWTLGTGDQRLLASVPGLAAPAVTFQATAVPLPAAIVKIAGDLQTGAMGATLPEPLRVRLLDAAGAPITGAPLEWDHGFATPEEWFAGHAFQWSTTDAAGEASILLTLKGRIASDSAEAVRAYVRGAKDIVVATFWLNVLPSPGGSAGAPMRGR